MPYSLKNNLQLKYYAPFQVQRLAYPPLYFLMYEEGGEFADYCFIHFHFALKVWCHFLNMFDDWFELGFLKGIRYYAQNQCFAPLVKGVNSCETMPLWPLTIWEDRPYSSRIALDQFRTLTIGLLQGNSLGDYCGAIL